MSPRWSFLLALACQPKPEGHQRPSDSVGEPGPDPLAGLEAPTVLINELLADNESGPIPSDWIELYNPGNREVLLDGWSLEGDDGATQALDGLRLAAHGYLLLWADEENGTNHLPFRLSSEGETLILRDPLGREQRLITGPLGPDMALARRRDGCVGEHCLIHVPFGSPGTSNQGPRVEGQTLGGEGHEWSYLSPCPDTAWYQPDADLTGWSSGPAPLGAGEDGLRTYLDLGPEYDRHVSHCFRTTFAISPGVSAAYLVLRRDDGARLYWDGEEILRDNLPVGTVSNHTWAQTPVGRGEELAYRWFPLEPQWLRPGTHHLGVAVHQASRSSGDLSLDVELLLIP